MTSTIETNVTEEDQSLIDDFWDNLKDMTITGGEVTLNKIGDCVSKMPIDDLQNLGKLIKKYSYYGALLALKESLDTKDMGPIGRYALAAGISVLVIPASYGVLSTTLLAIAIGAFVDVTWAYIEEHKDDIENKLKDLLASVEIEMDENTISVNYCPLPKYNAIYVKDNTVMSSNLTRTTAQVNQSPLVLDLDGDGVETTTVESGVYFDHDDNGFAEKSGWVGKDDGLLVRDINNNGLIDDGTELFGNNSVLSSGQKAANGFEALADLDSNSDGVFNSSDAAWNQVKVWKDANENGDWPILPVEQHSDYGFAKYETISAY